MNPGPSPAWLQVPAELLSVVATVGLAALVGLAELPAPPAQSDTSLQPPAFEPCGTGSGGYLRGQLHGDIQQTIDWADDGMRCDGMLRPEDAGLRLIFAPAEGAAGPLVVIGLDGGPEEVVGREVVANLTIVDEGNGRFFNSGPGERCWAQTSRLQPDAGGYEVAGRLYCAGALAEVNGPGTVTPGELEFAGRIPADRE